MACLRSTEPLPRFGAGAELVRVRVAVMVAVIVV